MSLNRIPRCLAMAPFVSHRSTPLKDCTIEVALFQKSMSFIGAKSYLGLHSREYVLCYRNMYYTSRCLFSLSPFALCRIEPQCGRRTRPRSPPGKIVVRMQSVDPSFYLSELRGHLGRFFVCTATSFPIGGLAGRAD